MADKLDIGPNESAGRAAMLGILNDLIRERDHWLGLLAVVGRTVRTHDRAIAAARGVLGFADG